MKMVLNADDFGKSSEINAAIDYSMRNGLVLSAALIVGSAFTDEAVEMALRGNYIDNVHLHLNIASTYRIEKFYVPSNENFKKSLFCENGYFKDYTLYNQFYHFMHLKYARLIFQELESQYLAFKEITLGKANYKHIDFHNYINLSPPVYLAFNRLIRKYRIQSARFFGEQQVYTKERRRFRVIHKAMMCAIKLKKSFVMKSCKIEHFLEYYDQMKKEKIVECFTHPEFVDGVLLDHTFSALNREMKPLEEHVAEIKKLGGVEFVSWKQLSTQNTAPSAE